MRIGNQPPTTVVTQPRVRPAEVSGSLAKAAPRLQVGRVAAFVQHINNGTFGSAETRTFRSSVKPAAFTGSPAKAGAPFVRAAPSTERMPVLPPLKSPALVLTLTGVVNRGGESNQTAPYLDLDALSALEPSRESVGQLAEAVHPSIVGEWKDVQSTRLPDATKPKTDVSPNNLSDDHAAGSPATLSRYVKRAEIESRLPQVKVIPPRFLRRGQTLQPVAARPLRPQHDTELPPRLKEVHPLALLPEAQSPLPLSPATGPDRLDRAGMTYVCFDSDDEGLGSCDTDWDSDSECGGDSDMDADVDLGHSASRIRTAGPAGTYNHRLDETEQLRRDVVRYRSELEAYDGLPLATRASLAAGLSDAASIKGDGQIRNFPINSLRKVNGETTKSQVAATEGARAEMFNQIRGFNRNELKAPQRADDKLHGITPEPGDVAELLPLAEAETSTPFTSETVASSLASGFRTMMSTHFQDSVDEQHQSNDDSGIENAASDSDGVLDSEWDT